MIQRTHRFACLLGTWTVAIVLVTSISSCKHKVAEDLDNVPENNAREAVNIVAAPPILGQAPQFELTDQSGRQFGTKQLQGKIWVANFIFTRCVETCPRQTSELVSLKKRLGDVADGEVQFVSITVDPEHDTSRVLQEYAQANGADWPFLTGSMEFIRDTVSENGFRLAVGINEQGATFHSPNFILIDPYLRVRAMHDSTTQSGIELLEKDIERLRQEKVPVPEEAINPPWLADRQKAQLETVADFDVAHDFSFSDRRIESGITFRNKIVDDGGRTYKPVHYDHGNGVVIADIDGDDLLDLFFVTQAGSNELWRNLGQGKFENITDQAGVALDDRICITASFADIDNDGDPDLYVTSIRVGNALFENLGGGKFRNISTASGLEHRGHSSGAVFFDYDRDGLLDVFLCNVGQYTDDNKTAKVTMEAIRGETRADYEFHVGFQDAFSGHLKPERSERSLLFRNLGANEFADVSDEVGLDDVSWTGDATAVDFNQDGWLDLYVLSMQGDDQYYVNQEGKGFRSAGRATFPRTPWGSMGVKAFDYDNDGDLDLYVTDMHSDMSEEVGPEQEKLKSQMQWPSSFLATNGSSIFGNAFYENQGDGTFKEISDGIGAENYWPWGFSVDDLNADGFDDVFIASSMNFPFRYGVNSVLLNNRGEKFLDSEFILGVEPRRGPLAVPWFELDLADRDNDAPIIMEITNRLESSELPARAAIWSSLGSRSSVIFDLENDGDLDIVTNEFREYPMVLVSNLAAKNERLRFLKIKLEGTKSNRSGLGAVVKLHIGQRSLMKVNDGKSGYLSQSDCPLYFGLGGAGQVDRIDVAWPSGVEQQLEGPIDVNRTLTITEPE